MRLAAGLWRQHCCTALYFKHWRHLQHGGRRQHPGVASSWAVAQPGSVQGVCAYSRQHSVHLHIKNKSLDCTACRSCAWTCSPVRTLAELARNLQRAMLRAVVSPIEQSSPSCLATEATVPSVMESPMLGTFTVCSACCAADVRSPADCSRSASGSPPLGLGTMWHRAPWALLQGRHRP